MIKHLNDKDYTDAFGRRWSATHFHNAHGQRLYSSHRTPELALTKSEIRAECLAMEGIE